MHMFADGLVFTWEALTRPVCDIGPLPVVGLSSTTSRYAKVTATLLAAPPKNFGHPLCDGMVRLRYRDGHQHTVDVVPDETYEVEIVMWDTCQRILPGHRLRVQIASSAFPKYDVNLGTGGDMVSETQGVIATQTLWHD